MIHRRGIDIRCVFYLRLCPELRLTIHRTICISSGAGHQHRLRCPHSPPCVTSDPVTSVTNARAPSLRPATAEELAGVTAKFEKLNIRPASLEPKKGNWAYHKTSPLPDNVPVADESHLWDGFRNPQEPPDEDGDEFPLEPEEEGQIRRLVCGAPFPGDSLPPA